MTAVVSAGILVYRTGPGGLEFLLVHPGGPFWKNKDTAGWSLPKGLVEPGEDPWQAALREFAEETGQRIEGPGIALTPCRVSGGKRVVAWLVAADLDPTTFSSNAFELEWPPGSGKRATFPEVDRGAYFAADVALEKVHRGQQPIVREAIALLSKNGPRP